MHVLNLPSSKTCHTSVPDVNNKIEFWLSAQIDRAYLPYECTRCKQRNRILVICAHLPRINCVHLKIIRQALNGLILYLCNIYSIYLCVQPILKMVSNDSFMHT